MVASAIIFSTILINAKLFIPQYIYAKTAADFESNYDISWRASKISDEYLPADFVRPSSFADTYHDTIPDEDGLTVREIVNNETYIKLQVTNALTPRTVKIARAYFPGYEYWVNGRKVTPVIHQGLPQVMIGSDFSTIEVFFKNTLPRLIGNIISFMSAVGIIYFYGKKSVS